MANPEDSELLADHFAGRLSAAHSAELERRLADDPDLAATARLAQAVRAAEEAGPEGPGAFGWARLSRSIAAEPQSEPAAAPKVGWRVPLWQAAAAVVVAVGLWQITVAPILEQGYVTASGDVEGAVQVAFQPDATAAEIAALLTALDAQIVAGPSALGLFTVVSRSGSAPEELLRALSAQSGLVESATQP